MTIPIDQLIRSHRRSISLQISPEGKLIVKAPYLVPVFLINRFVTEKQDWIERRIHSITVSPVKAKKKFVDGEKFFYLGELYELQTVTGQRSITISEKLYIPNIPHSLIKTELTMWYKARARKIIFERIDLCKKKTGLVPQGVTMSEARSKWGTCFHDNTMNFSWRLVMAPMSVIDYVVAHEFAHMKVKNHSRKFWGTVGSFFPEYRTHRRWLKKNGAMLDL
jgi:hypothetical protein